MSVSLNCISNYSSVSLNWISNYSSVSLNWISNYSSVILNWISIIRYPSIVLKPEIMLDLLMVKNPRAVASDSLSTKIHLHLSSSFMPGSEQSSAAILNSINIYTVLQSISYCETCHVTVYCTSD